MIDVKNKVPVVNLNQNKFNDDNLIHFSNEKTSSLIKTIWKVNTVLVLQFHIGSCKQRVENKL